MGKFKEESISDHKRLARGEHLLAARTHLRSRDAVHHRPWSVLMLAGDAPKGQVSALRGLMPRCRIVAVDNDPKCIDAAIDAGVDDVVLSDLVVRQDVVRPPSRWWATSDTTSREAVSVHKAPDQISSLGKFDLIDLDFCGPATKQMRQAMTIYRKLLEPRGVMMVTFSVGRDVEEVGRQRLQDYLRLYSDNVDFRHLYGVIPRHILGRILILMAPSELGKLYSVIYYRGANMPMCSLLIKFGPGFQKAAFVQLEAGDFELSVCYPDAALLYDCPEERIKELRQRHAALRAVLTRSKKKTIQNDDGSTSRTHVRTCVQPVQDTCPRLEYEA